ncbi:putative ABC transport system permease protein [Sphaerotilus hippei]|uniref:Putative ABC transport system permease protein n=1 Tax=Sphaerotilus hippei TaxID=744406 RepID=A0A318H5V0_9BURK|nr:ABC transporter permease [Sphaerotilus hippei]PXW98847.1 putative ABC transport system permease protein [Sphaerotilus hippei]
MKALLSLATRSAWNRRYTLVLVVLSIALSTLLLLGIERIRHQVRDSFAQTVSGTDLIVGARTGSVQLLLHAVFHVGSATSNMRWSSVQALAEHRSVAWVVPLSLGDSHRGRAVVATTAAFFEHFRHGRQQPLQLAEGRRFEDGVPGVFDAVLGAEVARSLGYRLGQRLVLSHGDGAIAANDHADKPFTVVGILAPTGTPVDRTVHINLAGMQALHLDWMAGAPLPGRAVPAEQALLQDLAPRQVTAVLVGLKSRGRVFGVQRAVAEFEAEPLMAVMPGVALDELWEVVGAGEQGLQVMSALVALVSLAGLVAVILAGLEQRRRELAILRAVGAGPRQILLLLCLEGGLVTACGVLLGALATAALLLLGAPLLAQWTGIGFVPEAPRPEEWLLMGAVLAAGLLASLVPGWRACRLALADGLQPRL